MRKPERPKPSEKVIDYDIWDDFRDHASGQELSAWAARHAAELGVPTLLKYDREHPIS